MKKNFIFPLILSLIFLSQAYTQEFYPSGEIKNKTSIGLPYTDDNAGTLLEADTTLSGNLKIFSDSASGFIDGSITFNELDSSSDTYGFSTKLKEAWIDYDGEWWALRIGRQITSWGKADGLEVTDILCPKDETSLSASDYAESRLGINAAKLSFKSEKICTDIYWIPVFTPSTLPLAENNPLKKIIVPDSIQIGEYTFPVNNVSEENLILPDRNIFNSEAALRISSYFSSADISLYGFYGYDREPVLSYAVRTDENDSSKTIDITGNYKRLSMFGLDAAIPVKEIVIRLEGAFFYKRFITDELKKNQFKALAGFDWMPSSWTVTAQYYMDYISGTKNELNRESFIHQTSLSLSKTFFQETLELSFTGLLDLNEFSSMLSVESAYSISDSLKLSLKGDFFIPGNTEDGLYGKYKDLSCFGITAVYKF